MSSVLVTGSAGFIGAHVAAAFTAAGWRVTGLDGATGREAGAWFRQDPGTRFDAVVHCAAVVGGRKVIDWTPIEHAANLVIDAELFRWAVRSRPGRVVYFSSSCAYPVAAGQPGRLLAETDIDLDTPGLPDGLYGWAKLTGERLAVTARDAGVPVTVARPFSVYGPGMKPGFAVTGFAAQAMSRADPLVIWGDDSQIRDYVHVSDVAAAVLAAIREGVDGPVNIGTGVPTLLRDLARVITRQASYAPGIKTDTALPAGVPSLVADTARLRSFYRPQVPLADGIAAFLASC